MQPLPGEADRQPIPLQDASLRSQGKPWWRETELWVLLLLTACFYTIRVGDLSVRGEESRRGRIAWEIWQTGDWIVPRIQGQPVFFRPPLQNWLIALVGMARGTVDEWALRLPSVAAMLLMVVVIYGYGRSFLSRFGAFFSGLSLISLGRDGFAVHALSGRFTFDLEVVSELRNLTAACLVFGVRLGGSGDFDKGAAGAALLCRCRFALLPDHEAPQPPFLARPCDRHLDRSGDRRIVADSVRNQDGTGGLTRYLFSRCGPAIFLLQREHRHGAHAHVPFGAAGRGIASLVGVADLSGQPGISAALATLA
jgi:hypothetical protein